MDGTSVFTHSTSLLTISQSLWRYFRSHSLVHSLFFRCERDLRCKNKVLKLSAERAEITAMTWCQRHLCVVYVNQVAAARPADFTVVRKQLTFPINVCMVCTANQCRSSNWQYIYFKFFFMTIKTNSWRYLSMFVNSLRRLSVGGVTLLDIRMR